MSAVNLLDDFPAVTN